MEPKQLPNLDVRKRDDDRWTPSRDFELDIVMWGAIQCDDILRDVGKY